MKKTSIDKTVGTDSISESQLEAIGRYSRRKLKADEVFVFSLILCDNEIDRDYERFSEGALDKLAELYIGKTGVFDHLPKAENQSARIFSTEVVSDGSKNSLGIEYKALKGWAYMVRCSKNDDLILEIDAGIKKEVSVGCQVNKINCSVCGVDVKADSCQHKKGNYYKDVLCYYLLDTPTDAYEWSFVAVPAQRNAGVTKRFITNDDSYKSFYDKLGTAKGAVTLSYEESQSLKNYIDSVSQLAGAGREYSDLLKQEIIRTASQVQPEMDCGLLEDICRLLEIDQLRTLHKSYEQTRARVALPRPQLAVEKSTINNQSQIDFKI